MEAWLIRLTSSSTAPSRRWLAAKLCPPDTTLNAAIDRSGWRYVSTDSLNDRGWDPVRADVIGGAAASRRTNTALEVPPAGSALIAKPWSVLDSIVIRISVNTHIAVVPPTEGKTTTATRRRRAADGNSCRTGTPLRLVDLWLGLAIDD